MISEEAKLKSAFRNLYGREATVYRAPGRVNLIGEHTDYNDGFVLPAAIDRYVWAAIAPRADRKIVIHSENYGETVEFDFDEQDPRANRHWSDYPRGVARMLKLSGLRLAGADLLIRGDIPIGAGLGSSGAFEVVVGFALLGASRISIERLELAELCMRGENEFVGVRCGLMDHFISCFGMAEKAIFLDCRSREHRPLPLPANVSLVVCDTMVKRDIAAGEYNTRRAECEEGVRIVSRSMSSVNTLRDVTTGDLTRAKTRLPANIFKRCLHVVRETERVTRAAHLLETEDPAGVGDLMYQSHLSLRDDYEVSCRELDLMVELARPLKGVLGARMTGSGFGGSTINLVCSPDVDAFVDKIETGYFNETGIRPSIYVVKASNGIEKVNIETTRVTYQGA